MKRFTETDKWRDPWFRGLPAPAKLVFFYFVDNCNNAGFHELDKDLMVILTGMKPEHCEGALKALTRGIIGPFEGWYWVRRFLRHQKNEEINPLNPAHKQIITLIRDQAERFKKSKEFQEFYGPYKGLLSPIGKGTGIGKGNLEEGVQREKPAAEQEVIDYCAEILLPRADADYLWNHWVGNGFRNDGKAMKDWRATVRSWKAAGHLPSQKPLRNGTTQQTKKSRSDVEMEEFFRKREENKKA